MEYIDALKARKNTSIWAKKIPDRQLIDDIVNTLHDYSPSKNSNVKYALHIYKNDNKQDRLNIYRGVKANTYENEPSGRHNPQVLAPWLLLFTDRTTGRKPHDPDIWMDIGIATATVAYTASSLGLATGLCKCMTYADETIVPVLGIRPAMIIGIGYADTTKDKYWCPVFNKFLPALHKNAKPQKTEYINEIKH